MPIPCHTGETAHSFIVGARYNRCNYMDARSYNRLGLYVPRHNPQHSFLKAYKGDDANTEPESDTGEMIVCYGYANIILLSSILHCTAYDFPRFRLRWIYQCSCW